ncbi:hypothetical protein COCSADRAFT_315974 [Bipolaris sorokiniana ND90Pr]|uniref:Uncharacterized protein n=1 Tax=Cochliobolus sativus (strain ND90Pr / ATCC 201652) TaxID=665912 RepID=M2T7H3_COCSN|nr:uncharacterized protein COCSADRAFT_315974 [Bipolaris sorokiniana ND90Pr]EMD64912.1 hypothetical protein COCSADRAFT_315974 [Bipolaris sorokiniana ND90Pr]
MGKYVCVFHLQRTTITNFLFSFPFCISHLFHFMYIYIYIRLGNSTHSTLDASTHGPYTACRPDYTQRAQKITNQPLHYLLNRKKECRIYTYKHVDVAGVSKEWTAEQAHGKKNPEKKFVFAFV